jgi:HlyD family secretion protein
VFEKFTKIRKLTELKAKAEDAKRELERTKRSQAAAVEKNDNELQAALKTAGLEKRHFDRLRAQLEGCIIKAPQDGIVIHSQYRPWDDSSRIRTGAQLHFQQPIFTLPDLDHMQVSLKVHESVVKKVQKGQRATMQVDALPNQVLHGKVKYVASLVQSEGWRGGGSKEYKTEVSIDDLPTDAGLRPGMTAEVKILIRIVPDALTVPVQAVTELDGKHICYVVSGASIERRTVKVGESNQQLIQIVDGLAEGERVALDARVRAAAELKTHENRGPAKKPAEPKKQIDSKPPG